jgi:hypothetical protein
MAYCVHEVRGTKPLPRRQSEATMNTMIKAATRKGRITPAMRARAREIAAMWRYVAEYEADLAD